MSVSKYLKFDLNYLKKEDYSKEFIDYLTKGDLFFDIKHNDFDSFVKKMNDGCNVKLIKITSWDDYLANNYKPVHGFFVKGKGLCVSSSFFDSDHVEEISNIFSKITKCLIETKKIDVVKFDRFDSFHGGGNFNLLRSFSALGEAGLVNLLLKNKEYMETKIKKQDESLKVAIEFGHYEVISSLLKLKDERILGCRDLLGRKSREGFVKVFERAFLNREVEVLSYFFSRENNATNSGRHLLFEGKNPVLLDKLYIACNVMGLCKLSLELEEFIKMSEGENAKIFKPSVTYQITSQTEECEGEVICEEKVVKKKKKSL